MKITTLVISILLIFVNNVSSGQNNNTLISSRPFPYHNPAISTRLGRKIVSDQLVEMFYDSLKKNYFRRDKGNRLFIRNDEKGDQQDNLTTSEATGYGMTIIALMAGYDLDAQSEFDSLYSFAMHHHSKKSSLLMRWRVAIDTCKSDDNESDTAIDGDLDMAYALLLANKQWPKTTHIDYGKLAQETLDIILKLEVDRAGTKLFRGNGGNDMIGSWSYNTIRLSDFMPAHFRAFYQFTHQTIWKDLLYRYERLFTKAQNELSPKYGLFPEYMIVEGERFRLIPKTISRAQLSYEGVDDGGGDNPYGWYYGYNSCRIPWRLATDYLLNGEIDPWAEGVLIKLSSGMQLYTRSNSCLIPAVCVLNDSINSNMHFKSLNSYSVLRSADLNIIGPLSLAALADRNNKDWQIELIKQLISDSPIQCSINGYAKRDYYENTLRVLCLLLMSGNYWSPDS